MTAIDMEQRVHPRVQLHVICDLLNLNEDSLIEGSILDISAQGFSVLISDLKFCRLGDQVTISFYFPLFNEDESFDYSDEEDTVEESQDYLEEFLEDTEDEELIKVRGIIRRINRTDENKVYLGVQVRDYQEKIAKIEETWLAVMLEDMNDEDDF
ncbi:MAG: hypothetical protein ACI86H_001051 [bacterium]|jgi:hypothetical protein